MSHLLDDARPLAAIEARRPPCERREAAYEGAQPPNEARLAENALMSPPWVSQIGGLRLNVTAKCAAVGAVRPPVWRVRPPVPRTSPPMDLHEPKRAA